MDELPNNYFNDIYNNKHGYALSPYNEKLDITNDEYDIGYYLAKSKTLFPNNLIDLLFYILIFILHNKELFIIIIISYLIGQANATNYADIILNQNNLINQEYPIYQSELYHQYEYDYASNSDCLTSTDFVYIINSKFNELNNDNNELLSKVEFQFSNSIYNKATLDYEYANYELSHLYNYECNDFYLNIIDKPWLSDTPPTPIERERIQNVMIDNIINVVSSQNNIYDTITNKHVKHLRDILERYKHSLPCWNYDVGKTDFKFEIKLKRDIDLKPQRNFKWLESNSTFVNETENCIKGWLESGICREVNRSELKHVSPLLLVKKAKQNKNDKQEYRLCLDLRRLNECTIPFNYDIPNLLSELHRFKGMKSCIKLDLKWGFNNVEIASDSQPYCGFTLNNKYYCLQRMGFGFVSAPSYFQYVVECLLNDIKGVYNYLDDIYIIGNNNNEVLDIFEKVSKALIEGGFKFRLDKCQYLLHEVKQLGRTVNGLGIMQSDKHVNKLIELKPPSSTTTQRSFSGQLQWLSSFLPNIDYYKHHFRVRDPFYWNKTDDKVFNELKEYIKVNKNNILYHPIPSARLVIDCDSSAVGYGAMISQLVYDKNNVLKLCPLEFLSNLWNENECKWHSSELEMLGVIRTIEKATSYYKCLDKTIIVLTDNTNILNVLARKTPRNNRISRWKLYLAQYRICFIHKPGKYMFVSDKLSRDNYNNELIKLIPKTFYDKEYIEFEHSKDSHKIVHIPYIKYIANKLRFTPTNNDLETDLKLINKFINSAKQPVHTYHGQLTNVFMMTSALQMIKNKLYNNNNNNNESNDSPTLLPYSQNNKLDTLVQLNDEEQQLIDQAKINGLPEPWSDDEDEKDDNKNDIIIQNEETNDNNDNINEPDTTTDIIPPITENQNKLNLPNIEYTEFQQPNNDKPPTIIPEYKPIIIPENQVIQPAQLPIQQIQPIIIQNNDNDNNDDKSESNDLDKIDEEIERQYNPIDSDVEDQIDENLNNKVQDSYILRPRIEKQNDWNVLNVKPSKLELEIENDMNNRLQSNEIEPVRLINKRKNNYFDKTDILHKPNSIDLNNLLIEQNNHFGDIISAIDMFEGYSLNENRLLCFEDRIMIPPTIANDIILLYHTDFVMNHIGSAKLQIELRNRFYIDNLKQRVTAVINGCSQCAIANYSNVKNLSTQPITVTQPLQVMQLDKKGPLPSAGDGYIYIFSMRCAFSGLTFYHPTKHGNAYDAIDCVLCFVSIYGTPSRIHTDNGAEFLSYSFNDLMMRLNITRSLGAVRHPSSQGFVESSHREFDKFVTICQTNNNLNWIHSMRLFQLRCNNSIYHATGVSPNELMFGFKLNTQLDLSLGIQLKPSQLSNAPTMKYINTLKLYKNINLQFAQNNRNILIERKQNKLRYINKKFNVGEYVLINYKAFDISAKKFTPYVEGYIIVFDLFTSVIVFNPETIQSHKIHKNMIKSYNVNKRYSNKLSNFNYDNAERAYDSSQLIKNNEINKYEIPLQTKMELH